MIELPPTLRAPRVDEVAEDSSVVEELTQMARANIVQGYKILHNKGSEELKQMPFTFYAEVNIDNSRLWALLNSLLNELPDAASLIFGYEGEELNYSDYHRKSELMAGLAEFEREIVQDTFIEIGLIYSDEAKLVEILIADSKYVKFWGVDKDSFREIMEEFEIAEVEDIEFMDEYPSVREPLSEFCEEAVPTDELIERLKAKYMSS